MADIFLSYAREDRPWASRLAAGLIEQGWSLFWDSDIPFGKTFDQVIEKQLDEARCIIVLWSRHSVSSNWVKAEASEGARRGILHPVLIDNVRLPLEFRRLQTANLIDWQRGTSHSEFDQFTGGIAATVRSQKGLRKRVQEARAALGRGDRAGCLQILREIADATGAAGLAEELAELRRTAEVSQDEARREELRSQRARAEEQRAAIGASRSQAQAAEAATRASALWLAAEAKMGEAAAAFDDEAYLRAAEDGEEATALYGQARDAAREAAGREEVERQRRAAEQAHERMSRAQESAQSTDARERAPTPWIDAERKATEGQAALAEDAPVRALKAFEEAAASYRQAEEAAREHMRSEEIQRRVQANQARDTAREKRNAAKILHAAQHAPNHWEDGETKFGEAETALAGEGYSESQRLFDEAARIYESAERAAREVLHREREGADASRALMAAEREAAQIAVADPREGPLWSAAEAAVAAAEAAYEREQYDGSTEGFAKAADLFQQSGRAALEQVRAERDGAERARAAMTRRREAAQASAPRCAQATWVDAEAKSADGESAFQGGDYVGAVGMFEQASDLYRRAEGAVQEGLHQEELRRQRDNAQAADDLLKPARATALDADAPQRAAELWQRAESAAAEGHAAFTSEQYPEAVHIFTEATALYRQAETGARAAVQADETRRQLEAAEHARERLAQSRMTAVALDAPACAPDVWRAGETRSAEGAEAFTVADPPVVGPSPPACTATEVEAPPPDLAETTVFDEAEGREPAAPAALPKEWPKPRLIRRLGGSRLVACVGGIAVVLSALGIYWYRPGPKETPEISTAPASPAPPAADREREVVEDLSKKAAAAREQATKANAERFANAFFATAAGHRGDAEAALADGRVADAQAAYRRAIDGYAVAATEAQKVLAGKQDETGRLQNQVEVSRRTAAGAQAENLAGPQWTKATSLHQAAQAAVAQGDYDKADELLKEATAGFVNAAKVATAESARRAKLKEDDGKGERIPNLDAGPSGARADAEQARLRMAGAKRAAEQVAAGFFAHKRFTSAQSKERDGIAALRQSDYGAAIRLLVEAQSEYQVAAQEARQEEERGRQLAPLRASLEQAQAAAAAGRQQALVAEADQLARDLFDPAQARHVEADRLANHQDLAAAARAYQEAAERYAGAMLRARAARAAK